MQEGETKKDRLSATASQADFAHSSVMRIAEPDTNDDAHRQRVTPEIETRVNHQTDVLPDHRVGLVAVECPHDAVGDGPFRQAEQRDTENVAGLGGGDITITRVQLPAISMQFDAICCNRLRLVAIRLSR